MGNHPLFVDLFKIKATTGVAREYYKSQIIGISPDDKQDSYDVQVSIASVDPVSYNVSARLGPLDVYEDEVGVSAAVDTDRKETSYDFVAKLGALDFYEDYVDVVAYESPPLESSYDVVAYLDAKNEYLDFVSVVAQVVQPSDAYDVTAEIGNLLADLEEEIDASRVQVVVKMNVNRSTAALRRYMDTFTIERAFARGRLNQKDTYIEGGIHSSKKQGKLIPDIERTALSSRLSDVNTTDVSSHATSERVSEKFSITERDTLGDREASKVTESLSGDEGYRYDEHSTYLIGELPAARNRYKDILRSSAKISMREREKDIVQESVYSTERDRNKEISTEERILSEIAAVPVDIIQPIYSDRKDARERIDTNNITTAGRMEEHDVSSNEFYLAAVRDEEEQLLYERDSSSSRISTHEVSRERVSNIGEVSREKRVTTSYSAQVDRHSLHKTEKPLELAAIRDITHDTNVTVSYYGIRDEEEELSIDTPAPATTDKVVSATNEDRQKAKRSGLKDTSLDDRVSMSDRKDRHSIDTAYATLLTRDKEKSVSTEVDERAVKKAQLIDVDNPSQAERNEPQDITTDTHAKANRMQGGFVKTDTHTNATRDEVQGTEQMDRAKATRPSDKTTAFTEGSLADRLSVDAHLSRYGVVASERQDASYDVITNDVQHGNRDGVGSVASDESIDASRYATFSAIKDTPAWSLRAEGRSIESTVAVKSQRLAEEEVHLEDVPFAHRDEQKLVSSIEGVAADKNKDKVISSESPGASIKKAKITETEQVNRVDRLDAHDIKQEEVTYTDRELNKKMDIVDLTLASRHNNKVTANEEGVRSSRDEGHGTETTHDNKAGRPTGDLYTSRGENTLADRERKEVSNITTDRGLAERKEQEYYIDVHDWLKGALKEDYKYIDINDMIYGERDNLQLTEKEGAVLYERIKDKLSELHAADLAVRQGINEAIKESGSFGQEKEEEDEEEEKLIWLVLGKPTWMHRWNTLKYR